MAEIKKIEIPSWAKSVIVHGNGIDGQAPDITGVYTVEQFLQRQQAFMRTDGWGEWDIIIYACANDDLTEGCPKDHHPYGAGHRYITLRSAPKCKIKKIAKWSYMGEQMVGYSTTRTRLLFVPAK